MRERSSERSSERWAGRHRRVGRAVGAVVLGVSWVGIGIGVGWAVGFLADRLVLPAHHGLVLGTLGLCAVVLCAWAYGTRLLYLEVRAGIEEATSSAPERRRTGYRYVALAAAPIVGVLIGLSSAHVATHVAGGTGTRPAAATAPLRARGAASETTIERPAHLPASSYVVRRGDRLTAIAERFYGSPADWPVLAKANASRLHEPSGGRLVDPTLLPLGLALAVPQPHVAASAPPPANGSGDGAPAVHDVAATHDASAREVELFAALGGFGLLGAALFARRQQRRRAYQQMRAPAGGLPPRLDPADARIEADLGLLVLAELPEWVDAANRLLGARLVADRSLVAPTLSVVRAGPLGVELLLDEPCVVAPEGFVVCDGGRSWRLDPRLGLDEVRAAGADAQPYLAGLIPIGEDETGSYLVACGPGESLGVHGSADEIARGLGAIVAHLANAPWGEVACYRVGPAHFVGAEELQALNLGQIGGLDEATERDPLWRVGLPEHQPVALVEDPVLAEAVRAAAPAIVSVIGPMRDADRLLYFEGDTVTIEPLGLRLPALLPAPDELRAVARLRSAAQAVPVAVPDDVGALPMPDAALPVAGPIEVRILRAVPDLVGEVEPSRVTPDVVQLVAYLTLHNRRASTSKLRDVFGLYRPDASRQQKTVWNATSNARRALGVEHFPLARGSRPYTISEAVTCDWLRFTEIVSIARALELAGEVTQAIDALAVALELVGEGVPCSDDAVVGRYVWLDAEQHLVEMEATIVAAAHSMAMLSIAHHPYPASLDDAAWAIARGRVISPEARPLREAAMYLADARGDTEEVAAELGAAVDAVDALELGEDVDPVVETLYQALGRARRPAPPTDPAFA